MEKLATPSRRFYWPRAIGTVMAFQIHNLWWIAVVAGLYAVMIFVVLGDNFGHSAVWAESLLAELGQNFGALNSSMFAALLSASVPFVVIGVYQQQTQSRGFSLLAAVPGSVVLGHFALALGIGLLFPLMVFLIGISSAGLYSLPQEPFWISLLVGIGAFFLAARVYEWVEA